VSKAGLGVLALAIPIFLAAASLSRAYVANGRMPVLLLSLGLYLVGNIIMVRLMREAGLGLAISISAVAQLVLVNIVAVTVFGERPTGVQLAGIGLGVMSVALLALPAGPR